MSSAKDELYELIICQLVSDGFIEQAERLRTKLGFSRPRGRHQLFTLIDYRDVVKATRNHIQKFISNSSSNISISSSLSSQHLFNYHLTNTLPLQQYQQKFVLPSIIPVTSSQSRTEPVELSFDEYYENSRYDRSPYLPEIFRYVNNYTINHKGKSSAYAFDHDGSYFATSGNDCSLKVVEVEKAQRHRQTYGDDVNIYGGSNINDYMPNPVVRQINDHHSLITALQFHPFKPYLISGSDVGLLNIYDNSKVTFKKPIATHMDRGKICVIKWHSSGDYLLVCCSNNNYFHLFNTETFQSYTAVNPKDNHFNGIRCADYSHDRSKQFVTGGLDGHMKLWSTESSRCLFTFNLAHKSAPIISSTFSKNDHFLLSSGQDNLIRLWDLRMRRCLHCYSGALLLTTAASFNHTEEYVMAPCSETGYFCIWNTRTGEREFNLFNLGQVNFHAFQHHPYQPFFLALSDTTKFWSQRLSRS
ncbi:hypothetical protein SNEBB_003835 [Seison nebaliae]|nr:hypothetical protein SNEBB_003835 [Seison nebaliae]